MHELSLVPIVTRKSQILKYPIIYFLYIYILYLVPKVRPHISIKNTLTKKKKNALDCLLILFFTLYGMRSYTI